MAETDEALLVELECPVCKDYMSPPIHLCATGHSVCDTCCRRLPKCPLCQAAMTEAKNLALEALACKMRYPCVYRGYGCEQVLSFEERRGHEAQCPWRGFSCAMLRCPWVGRKEGILAHWRSKERVHDPLGGTNKLSLKVKPRVFYANIVSVSDQLFWFKYKIESDVLYFAVQFVGDAEDAKKYRFYIEACVPERPHCCFEFSCLCVSAFVDNDQLFKQSACIQLPLSVVENYVTDDQVLNYTFKVITRNVFDSIESDAKIVKHLLKAFRV